MLKDSVKVSIIVPNYNHARFLSQRLDSIFNQTFTDYEVILLDDCSHDGSFEILMRYKNHTNVSHCIKNKINSGSTFKQWEKGINLATGQYIWIAESDDIADSHFLEKLVPVLDDNSDVGLVYCQSFIIDEKGTINGNMIEWTKDLDAERWNNDFHNVGKDELRNFFCLKNTIPNASAVLFRKSKLNASYGKRYKLCGDKMIYSTLLLISDISFVSAPLNYYRFHKSSVRSNIQEFELLKETIYFYGFLFKNLTISPGKLYKIIDQNWGYHIFLYITNSTYDLNRRMRLYLNCVFFNFTFLKYITRMLLIKLIPSKLK